MSNFNLNDYETVESRLQRYLEVNKDARIITKVEYHDENRILIKAYIYKTVDEQNLKLPHATGIAEETRGEGYVNKTSHVENCETSAIGRALANAGYSGNKNGSRASRQEMEKVQRLEDSWAVGIVDSADDIPGKCSECQAVGKYHKPDCPNNDRKN